MINRVLFLLLCSSILLINGETQAPSKQKLPLPKKSQKQAPKQAPKPAPKQAPKREVLIPFSFERKSLIDILELLMNHKGATLILPQGANLEVLKKQTITFTPRGSNELPFNEAWNLMLTFLDLSRFALSPRSDGGYVVVPVGKPDEAGIAREILPLYANVPWEKLPKSDERIRYLYYLRNLKIPTQEDRETNPISRIFKDLLSPGTPVIYEPKANGFVITDKASTIASAMMIISELDRSGFRETIEIIELHYVPAPEVVKVFDMLRKAAGEAVPPQPFIRSDARTESLGYFASDTKIIADPLENRLILMGRESAVERISDFVREHMDTAPETGKSILHYYDLQYLDAKNFAEVLSRIVAPPEPVGGQARAAASVGPERYFQGVVVMAEETKKVEARATTEEVVLEAKGSRLDTGLNKQATEMGGNRLIVAALQPDWERLVDFIQSVDKPEKQVILEVLIVDIISTKSHILAGTTRSINDCNSPTGVEFLSSNISPVNNVLGATPPALNLDLLRVLNTKNSNDPTPVTSLLAQGSLIISINDPRTPGVWSLIQVLDSVVNSKVLSHPYLITTNNQLATIASQEIRRVQGDAVPGAAGVVTIEIIDLPATLQVQMVPRISSPNRLSLQVAVDINEFVSTNSTTRTTRRVNTNANMASGQVLVIGGLTRVDQADQALGTPLLNRIPIVNLFFSNKTKTVARTNLAILISPTIIEPKLRGGLDIYTADKIRKSRRDIDDSVVFGDRRDPITRFFFNTGQETEKLLRDYLSEVKNPPDAELIKTKKERLADIEKQKRARPLPKIPVKPGIVKELPA